MSHLFRLFCLASALTISTARAAEVAVVVGTGTESSNKTPYSNYYYNSTCQFIVPATELIGRKEPISAIAFEVATASRLSTNEVNIYVGTSTTTSFASSKDVRDVESQTLVYTGHPTLGVATGWEELTFTTPYMYDGKSNLVFTVTHKSSSYSLSLKYAYTQVQNSCLLRYSDENAAYADPSDQSITYSTSNYRPNMKLSFGTPILQVINGVTYKAIGNEAEVVAFDASQSDGILDLASQITGEGRTFPVTRIRGVFQNCTDISSVTIPASITTIDKEAFSGCSKIETVFNLSDLDIKPNSTDNGSVAYEARVVYRGKKAADVANFRCYESEGRKFVYAYVGTDTEVTLPQGYEVADYAFFDRKDITRIVIPEGCTQVGGHAFQKCHGLTEVVLPQSLDRIGEFAFGDCYALTTAALPRQLRSLQAGAFMNCKKLESVDLPATLTELGPFAFKSCELIPSVKVPAGIDHIDVQTFMYCSKLKEVELPETLTSIAGNAFYYAGVESMNWPSMLEEVGSYAFAACDFTQLLLPSRLRTIGEGAFSSCSSVTELSIPEGVIEVKADAFNGCRSLSKVVLPTTLQRISKRAFQSCAIRYINWPKSLHTLGFKAFASAANSPVIPGGIDQLGHMLFYGCNDMSQVFCYADDVFDTAVFVGSDLSESTLYVKPGVLGKFRASALASLFKDVMPLGDYDGDGQYTVGDLLAMASLKKRTQLFPGALDLDGNGAIDATDIGQMQRYILESYLPQTGYDPAELPTVGETVPADQQPAEPSAGCRWVVMYGTDESTASASLEYLNELRLEACLEGVRCGSRTSNRHLTIDNYYPLKWSTDLERNARIRAVESYLTRYHQRLNGKSWSSLESNGVSSYSELLAFYADMRSQASSYYGEKYYWVNDNPKNLETGHYTTMITQSYTHVGMAEYEGTATMQMARLGDDVETTMLDDTDYHKFYVEVKDSYITGHEMFAVVKNNRVFNDVKILDDDIIHMYYRVVVEFVNSVGQQRGFYLHDLSGVTYTSSNPEVASIDANGKLKAHQAGTTIVTGSVNGEDPVSITVTVACHHTYTYREKDADNVVTGTCDRCGHQVNGKVPTYMRFYWNNSTSGSSYYYSGTPTVNPVGSTIDCWLHDLDGDSGFNEVVVECSDPSLLDTPATIKSSIYSFLVLGEGDVTLTFYPKYNPDLKRTFTLHLGDGPKAASFRDREFRLMHAPEQAERLPALVPLCP